MPAEVFLDASYALEAIDSDPQVEIVPLSDDLYRQAGLRALLLEEPGP